MYATIRATTRVECFQLQEETCDGNTDLDALHQFLATHWPSWEGSDSGITLYTSDAMDTVHAHVHVGDWMVALPDWLAIFTDDQFRILFQVEQS